MKRFGMLSVVCVIGLLTGGARAETGALPAGLENKIREKFATIETPGAVYGVYVGEKLEPKLRLALGFADEKKSRPISFDDHFRIASVTKSFVGIVILQLLDEGKLSLDDPISKYVDKVPSGDKITLRMLGNHTSGITTAIGNPKMQQAIVTDPQRSWTDREILDMGFEIPLRFEPGTAVHYSNTNTVLLGMVIEKITGDTWQQAIHKRILEPLNLKQTGSPGKDGKLPDPTPRAYRFGKKDNLIKYGDFWFDATNWSSSWAGAAGDMYSTLDDLARFTYALAKGKLVGAKGREAQFAYVDSKTEGIEYGFHIFRQLGAVGSIGDVPGFSAMAVYMPEFDVTIVCLANLTATSKKLTAASELGELTVAEFNATTHPTTAPTTTPSH